MRIMGYERCLQYNLNLMHCAVLIRVSCFELSIRWNHNRVSLLIWYYLVLTLIHCCDTVPCGKKVVYNESCVQVNISNNQGGQHNILETLKQTVIGWTLKMYYSSATHPQLAALTRLGKFNNSPLCSLQQTDTMLNNGYSDIVSVHCREEGCISQCIPTRGSVRPFSQH